MLVMVRTTNTRRRRRRRSPRSSGPPPDDHRTNTSRITEGKPEVRKPSYRRTSPKGEAAMTTQAATANRPNQDSAIEQKIQELRDAFSDAPQMARRALENRIQDLASHMSESRSRME